MSPFVKYGCGCLEGPVPGEKCWKHGVSKKEEFDGVQNTPQRGVAQYIDCIMGRPISVWITNDRCCSGANICPSRYLCKYKPAQGKLL